jgi:hypothetical protein
MPFHENTSDPFTVSSCGTVDDLPMSNRGIVYVSSEYDLTIVWYQERRKNMSTANQVAKQGTGKEAD